MNHARVLPTKPEIGLRGGLTSVFDQRALMTPVAEAAMPAFDYSTVAELFPNKGAAELFPAKYRRLRREPVR